MDILNKEYIMSNPTKEKLIKLNFRYSKTLSNNEESIYILRSPIYKYKKYTTLECVILIDSHTGKTSLDVYDCNTNKLYPACYNENMQTYKDLLKKIEYRLQKLINSMGLKELE